MADVPPEPYIQSAAKWIYRKLKDQGYFEGYTDAPMGKPKHIDRVKNRNTIIGSGEVRNSDDAQPEPYIQSAAKWIYRKLKDQGYFEGYTNYTQAIDIESDIESQEITTANQKEQDLSHIANESLELEYLFSQSKLSYDHLDKYQSELDKIALEYQNDQELKEYWYVLMELQFLIYYVKEDWPNANMYLLEAMQIKPDGQSFVSNIAQSWEVEMQDRQKKQKLLDKQNKKAERKQSRSHRKYRNMAIALAVISVLVLWGPVSDWYTLHNANPKMMQLANDASMSRSGKLLFLRASPRIDSPSQFQNDCTTANANNNGTSLLGCYDPSTNRIYLLTMPSQLYNVEVTTAAYEMLHIAYYQLIQSDSSKLKQAIENNYNIFSYDQNLSGQVKTFAKIEPGQRDLELFSILCTEYPGITNQLSSYCSRYFTDSMSAVVSDNQQVDNLFSNDQSQLTQLDNSINQYQAEATAAYNDSVGWANIGNQYEDNYDYNIYVQDLITANRMVDQYNALLNTFNTLVTAYTGGQPLNQQQSITAAGNQ